MALEPRVTVNTVDKTIGYNADPVDSRLNILCPVISPAGPTELTRVSGPSEFQRLYFGGRSVKSSDHMSAIYARALLASAPIWIKRGVRNNIKGGLSSALGEEVYVDSSLNTISGIKVNLELDTAKVTEYSKAVSDLKDVVRDGLSVYAQTEDKVPANLKKHSASTLLKKSLIISNALTSDTTITIGSNQFTLKQGTTAFDKNFVQSLYNAGILPQAVELKNKVQTVVIDNKKVPEVSADKLSWISNLTILISGDTANLKAESDKTTAFSITLKNSEEYINGIAIADFKFDLVMTDSSVKYCFYAGSSTPTAGAIAVKLDSGYSTFTFEELYKNLTSQCADLLGADTGSGYSIIIPEGTVNSSSVTSANVKGSISEINTSVENDRFAVISAFPCSASDMTISISEGDIEGTYKVTADYSSLSESWTIAFDTGIYDGYGESLYFQKVNDSSQLIRIVELQGSSVLPQTFTIGDEITSKYCDVSEMISAVEEMKETDESGVFFDYLCDGGVVDSSLSRYLFSLEDFYHSFYVPSCYVDKPLTVASIKELRSSLGNHAAGRLIAHTQRAQVLDSGSVVMPASYFYLVERINVGNTALEFCNMFGPNYGDIGMQNPLQKFTTAEREALLDVQVATLKKGITGNWYLNSNCTLYKTDSFLQEDGIVLMVNKINQIADRYAQTVIGLGLSTPETVMTYLRDTLTGQIRSRLRVGTSEGPANIRVVCDGTNNPSSLLNQGKIRVDIYATFGRSIKEVLVYSYVMPLE